MGMRPRRWHGHHTHLETHRVLQLRQPGFAQPNFTPWPAFLTAYRLPPSTYRAAQPPDPQQSHTLTRPRAGRTTLAEMRVLRSTCSRAPAPTKIDMPSSDEVQKAASWSAEELCAVWWLQSPCWVPGTSLRATCRISQARVRGQVRTEASTGRSQPGTVCTSSIRLRTIIVGP